MFSCTFSQPQTPNLEDDINEVIQRDAGMDLAVVRSTPPEERRKIMVQKRLSFVVVLKPG